MKRYSLGKKIAALLQDAGLTQADLAKMLGLQRASVNTWIQGRHTPTSNNIEKLSMIFGIEVNWFRDDEARYPPASKYRLPATFPGQLQKTGEGKPGARDRKRGKASKGMEQEDRDHTAIEIINENLFRVNNPKLRDLFHQLEHALKMKDNRRVSGLCNRLNMLLRGEAGEKTIEYYPMHVREGKEGSQDAGAQE